MGHQYNLAPDLSAGNRGVYTNHVKYASRASNRFDVHVYLDRAWLGVPHPDRLLAQFHPIAAKVPLNWDRFDLFLHDERETRPEFRSKRAANGAITGVYVDSIACDFTIREIAIWLNVRQ